MELITYSLRTVAKAIIEPTYLLMLIVFGIIFYLKNKKPYKSLYNLYGLQILLTPVQLLLSFIIQSKNIP